MLFILLTSCYSKSFCYLGKSSYTCPEENVLITSFDEMRNEKDESNTLNIYDNDFTFDNNYTYSLTITAMNGESKNVIFNPVVYEMPNSLTLMLVNLMIPSNEFDHICLDSFEAFSVFIYSNAEFCFQAKNITFFDLDSINRTFYGTDTTTINNVGLVKNDNNITFSNR